MGQQKKNLRINQKYLETHENGHTTCQNLWDAAKAVLRGKLIAINVDPQETRKISTKQPNFTPQGTRKRTNEAQG